MGKKEKYQDNRDIFEKALDDNRPLVHGAGGALIGAALGAATGRIGKAIARGRGWKGKVDAARADYRKSAKDFDKNPDSLSRAERMESDWDRLYGLKTRGEGKVTRGALSGGTVGGITGMYHGYISQPMHRAEAEHYGGQKRANRRRK